MSKRTFFLLACLAISIYVFAQEGHPLTGTWSGDWGPTTTQRTHITLVMNWEGKNISGILNPGPDAVQIPSIFLDVTNWTVRIEADAKDPSGSPVHITAEGKIDDLASYHRKIIGTWRQGNARGDFRITRD